MITFHDVDETYLWISQKGHQQECQYKDKLGSDSEEDQMFEDRSLKILISSTFPIPKVSYPNVQQRQEVKRLT